MSIVRTNPFTCYPITSVIGLADRAKRERLNPNAVRTFFKFMAHWKIRDHGARRLLGGVLNALNILHSEEPADRRKQPANRNTIFGGTVPHVCLMHVGLSAFATVRILPDARQGSHWTAPLASPMAYAQAITSNFGLRCQNVGTGAKQVPPHRASGFRGPKYGLADRFPREGRTASLEGPEAPI